MKADSRESILIFRDHLLKRSETFILAQTQAFVHFKPYYAGSRDMHELELPPERIITINHFGARGKVIEIPFKLFAYAPGFIRRIKAVDPALIHAHFGPDGVLALPVARAVNVPLIVTFHGYDATIRRDAVGYPFFNSHRIYFRNEASLKREARLFIAVSDFIKRKLVERGFPPDRILVHYIGVDTQAFRPNQDIPRQPIVLFVGRLVEVKGCEYLLRAMKDVLRQVPATQLVIIGEGPLRPALERLVQEEGISNCHFIGWQSHRDVQHWLNKAWVYCAPSIVARSGAEEGFSIALLEAMACGLPVVSFLTGGTPEVVHHGETGFLAQEKNVAQLSAYIVRLLQDHDLWKECSQAGQSLVRSNFDLYRQTEKLEQIYRTIINPTDVFERDATL
jgi:glycosyltransferase involved in cell wall biosynthesis